MAQPDLFGHTRGPSGEQLKKEAFDRLTSKYSHWLDWARELAYELLKQRTANYALEPDKYPPPRITSDDVWDRWPPPEGTHPSVMGPLFHDRRFLREGYEKSKRPSAHSRVISIYILNDRQAP